MTTSGPSSLLARSWTDELVQATCSQLNSGRVITGDFSKAPLDRCRRVVGAHVESSSFDAASFEGLWVETSTFRNCTFGKANLRGLRDHGNTFTGSVFNGSRLKGATLGIKGTVFSGCQFNGVDFRGCGFVRPRFEDCRFRDCILDGVDFEASRFVACTFIGRLRNVWFRADYSHSELSREFGRPQGPPTLSADFSEASLWGVGFSRGLDLKGVSLPTDGAHFRFESWPDRLRAIEFAAAQRPSEIRKSINEFVQVFRADERQRDYVVNRADLVSMFGEGPANEILKLLGEPAA